MARPEIRYARTSDGANIAFYEMGEGPPLVIAVSADFANHLRLRLIPEYHRDRRGLGRFNRIVRYDSRGTGLSDRDTPDLSLRWRYNGRLRCQM